MDHFIDTKIPKFGIFVDKNSQNDQTPFPKVGRKTPDVIDIIEHNSHWKCLICSAQPITTMLMNVTLSGQYRMFKGYCDWVLEKMYIITKQLLKQLQKITPTI